MPPAPLPYREIASSTSGLKGAAAAGTHRLATSPRPQRGGRAASPNSVGIPPARSTSRSSMLSAPAHIPAIRPNSLRPGSPRRIESASVVIDTFPAMIRDNRVCSASPTSGISPALLSRCRGVSLLSHRGLQGYWSRRRARRRRVRSAAPTRRAALDVPGHRPPARRLRRRVVHVAEVFSMVTTSVGFPTVDVVRSRRGVQGLGLSALARRVAPRWLVSYGRFGSVAGSADGSWGSWVR